VVNAEYKHKLGNIPYETGGYKLEIKKVGIIGMGAIGGMIAAQIHDWNPNSVYIIGDKERITRYKEQGWIQVNGQDYEFNSLTPENAQPLDLIILSVKYHQLDDAILLMKNFVGESTIIISLMNGINTEQKVGAVYGMEKLLYSFIVEISAVKNDTEIFANKGKIVFNSLREKNEKTRCLGIFFDQANIVYEIAPNIIKEIWWKFMINVGINQTSAVLDANYGHCQTVKEIRELIDAAMKEVILISTLEGVNLEEEDLQRWYPVLDALNPSGMTSMLQDMRAKRKTEVEMFSGVICQLGNKYGVQTPINNMLFQLIKAKEKMNKNLLKA